MILCRTSLTLSVCEHQTQGRDITLWFLETIMSLILYRRKNDQASSWTYNQNLTVVPYIILFSQICHRNGFLSEFHPQIYNITDITGLRLLGVCGEGNIFIWEKKLTTQPVGQNVRTLFSSETSALDMHEGVIALMSVAHVTPAHMSGENSCYLRGNLKWPSMPRAFTISLDNMRLR